MEEYKLRHVFFYFIFNFQSFPLCFDTIESQRRLRCTEKIRKIRLKKIAPKGHFENFLCIKKKNNPHFSLCRTISRSEFLTSFVMPRVLGTYFALLLEYLTDRENIIENWF